ARHAANDRKLGGILLAEVRQLWLDDVEEFCHHRGNSAKVPCSGTSAELVTQAFDRNPGDGAARVHVVCGWNKDKVDSFALQQFSVTLKIPWILSEVLVRGKLRGVHKDGGGHKVALRPSRPHQREVAFVQRPHRGH